MKSFLPFLSVERKREIVGILTLTLGVLILVSLATHSAADDLWFTDETIPESIAPEAILANQGGVVGAGVSFVLLNLFGFFSLFVPVWLCCKGWALISSRPLELVLRTAWLAFLSLLAMGVLFGVPRAGRGDPFLDPASTLGGFVAHWIALGAVRLFGTAGGFVVCLGVLLVMLAMLVSWRPRAFLDFDPAQIGAWFKRALGWLSTASSPVTRGSHGQSAKHGQGQGGPVRKFLLGLRALFTSEANGHSSTDVEEETPRARRRPPVEIPVAHAGDEAEEEFGAEPPLDLSLPSIRPRTARKAAAPPRPVSTGNYVFPGIELLTPAPPAAGFASRTEIESTAQALQQTLETFGVTIEGPIRNFPGPVITRFEFKPASGIKVNQVVSLADDLALALSAKRIRIIAPIPGKPAVGVEIPNRQPQTVYLSEIIHSAEFARTDRRLPLALGKTTGGQPFVADLARMPHLLIAGATGSGKSVCINAMITSLVYRLPPECVRFLFIDPKMLELPMYDGIPHMERPVVTKAKQAEKMLMGAVGEMEERYGRLAKVGVRNIEAFNERRPEELLPYIVIVVDELADLMMSAESNRIETTIARLAQMARAVGIHLILATQRPSVDVITGVIKANFSSRIAFQVASKIDSRTILDGNGAERLLGRGDMLFGLAGEPEPIRLHGAFVSSEETEAIVEHLRAQSVEAKPIATFAGDEGEEDEEFALGGYSDDPLFREAAEVVIKAKMGSVSLLQRRLGIGYQRAGRLVDQLERAGVVGPHDGSRAREVLVDLSYLETKV